MQNLFMGIDLGGTVIKAGIYNSTGQEITVAEQQQPPITDHVGFSERDLDRLWDITCTVIKQAIEQATILPVQIKGISFSSHGKGLYLLDRQGQPIYNGILSSDNRAQSIVDDFNRSGIAFQAYQHSLQQLWPSHPAALLNWLKNSRPDIYHNIGYILMAHDYIRYRLTGNISCEVTNISGSNLFNQQTADYDPMLFELFQITEMQASCAPIMGSTDLAGVISDEVAQVTTLAAGTPVFGGLFDVVGAALISGVTDASSLSAVAGTWTISTRVFDHITTADYPYVWGRYCIDGQYFVHEGSPTSASNLAWFIEQYFPHDPDIYSKINGWVEECYCHPSSSLIFYPWLFGSNFDSRLAAGFLGLQGHHSKKEMVYAIYEGIVFSHLLHQDRILSLAPSTRVIRFTGGPTRSTIWMQLFCDATNLPVEVITVKQSGCLAAALCAAVGSGEFSDFNEGLRQFQPQTRLLKPNSEKHAILRQKFARFKAIARCLATVDQ